MPHDNDAVNPELAGEDRYTDGSSAGGGSMDGLSFNCLPETPHPAVAKLPLLTFETLPENFFVLIYGQRRTGKTFLLHHLLESVADRFDYCYVFSETCRMHIGESGETDFDFVVEDALIEGFDTEMLDTIIEAQKETKLYNNKCKYERDKKPNKTLLIFDDFVHNNGVRYSQSFTRLPVLGRHYDLSVNCLSQGYTAVGSAGLNPATRQNADFVMTFLPRNIGDIERIADWYLARPKLESMWFIQSCCRAEHMCLGMDLTQPHKVNFEEHCYKIVAPAKQSKYRVGKEQWKQFVEEKKRRKQTELAQSLSNQRAYWSGHTSQEVMSKLNEATGINKSKTASGLRPTLFSACRDAGIC